MIIDLKWTAWDGGGNQLSTVVKDNAHNLNSPMEFNKNGYTCCLDTTFFFFFFFFELFIILF